MQLVLASQSAARRAMLTAAGVPHVAVTAMVDEDAAKRALLADGAAPRAIADTLAELKARKVSQQLPEDLVLGCDSVVVDADGTLMNKPLDRADAAAQLARLSGTTHRLISAAVLAERGAATWRHVDSVAMTMRPLGAAFIHAYLNSEWPAIQNCVGCYRLEGRGAQLFAAIDGSHFTVLGLPLLPLLAHLRQRKLLAA
ncbi:MAG: Maf family protein [Sphingomonas sp.]